MYDKLSQSPRSYPEIVKSPLDSKNELNLGISNEFLSIYESKLVGSRSKIAGHEALQVG